MEANLTYIPVNIDNNDNSDTRRWEVAIVDQGNDSYRVEDTAKHSLFPKSMFPFGTTPGDALDRFLTVEAFILSGLGEVRDMTTKEAHAYCMRDAVGHDDIRTMWISLKVAADTISEEFKGQWKDGYGHVTGPYYLASMGGNFYEVKTKTKK